MEEREGLAKYPNIMRLMLLYELYIFDDYIVGYRTLVETGKTVSFSDTLDTFIKAVHVARKSGRLPIQLQNRYVNHDNP